MKGNGTLGRWMRNVLLTVCLGLIATVYASLSNRVAALEDAQSVAALNDVRIQSTLCTLLDAVYDLREVVDKRPVFRRPCP